MKNILLCTFVLMSILLFSCNSQVESIPEENILHISGKIEDIGSLEDVYKYTDYVVICEVTDIGNPYLRSGNTLDTSLPTSEIMKILVGLRTPYEITVKSSYKGSLNPGDSYTVVSLEGQLGGYAVDAGLPNLEVGKTYFMPICISDPDESIPYFPALVEIDNTLSKSSDNDSAIIPLMFDSPYNGINNLANLLNHLQDISNNNQ